MHNRTQVRADSGGGAPPERDHENESVFEDRTRELEAEADRMLRSAGALGRHQGIYTTTQLKRKIRLELQRIPEVEEWAPSHDVLDYLTESYLDDLVCVSRLTAMQEIVFRLRASGLDCKDMTATLGIKHEVLAGHLRQARWKVRAACKQGRYAGWYEVYLSEVNRPAYRARRARSSPEALEA